MQVEIDGNSITAATAAGPQITGGGTTVRNLAIHGFPQAQLVIGNLDMTGTVPGGNVIQGNYIGTDATGAGRADRADGLDLYSIGIQVAGSTGNTIGGTAAAAGNTISGNGSTVGPTCRSRPMASC